MMKIFRKQLSRSASGLLVTCMLLMAVFSPVSADSHTSSLATAEASIETVSREFRLDGIVEAINRTTVSAQTSGTIMSILVDVDDYVEQGALIIRLKDTSQQAQLKKAQANANEAQSKLSQAEDEYQRISDIFEKKVVSQSEMDQATHALSAAKARLEAARAGLDEAREQLSHTRITAPYSGFVTERHVEVGETVQPGSHLMTGVSLNKLRVNIDIPQSVVTSVREYGKAYVYTGQRDENGIEQRVLVEKMTIFPIADRASNTFKVRLDLPEGIDGLFPGMFVKASMVTGEKKELVVPASCVVRRSEVTAVYVIEADGDISFRHVRLGSRLPGIAEQKHVILAGLADGETIALDPIKAGNVLMKQRRHASQASTDDRADQ